MTRFSRYPQAIIHPLSFALITLSVLLLIGCSRVSQETEHNPETQTGAIQIELVEPLFPAAIGKETLNIRVFDANNQPIDNAKINIRGDMTHAGMTPILAETENGNKGLYQLPIAWSMSGDWIVTVQVILPDGTIAEQTFPRTIANDAADCEHEATDTP
ncbi:MAG: FixH family protein [Anaerolineae bacterium]|nr:FixH family protein [Anaerolineae bacterium]